MTEPDGEPPLRRQLMRGGFLTILTRALSLLMSLLSSIVLAQVLGPAQLGIYASVIAIVAIVAMPVQLGLPTLVVRETARAAARADWAALRGIWRWATVFVGTGAALITAVVVAGLILFPARGGEELRRTVLWAVPLIPLLALGNVRAAALTGLRHLFLGAFPEKVLRPALLALGVGLLAVMWGREVTASTAMAVQVTAALAVFLLGAWLLWRARPAPMRNERSVRFEHRAWVASILPLSAIAGLQVLSHNTDLVMLAAFRSDEEVGLYRVAVNTATLVNFGLTAILALVQPHFARLHAQGDMARLQRLATLAARIAVGATLPAIAVLVAMGTPIITLLFGAAFGGAYAAMLILSGAQLVSAFVGGAGSLLSMSGNEAVAMRALVLSTVLNIALNALLIPRFGIEGAAVATGLSIAVWNLLFWRGVRARLGIDSSAIGRAPAPRG